MLTSAHSRVPKRRLVLAATFFAVTHLLSACSTNSGGEPALPPVAEQGTPTRVLPPVMVSAEQSQVAVRTGDTVVLLLEDPGSWDVTVSPDDLAIVLPGGDQGGYSTNPAVVVRRSGIGDIRMLNRLDGTLRTVTLVVSDSTASPADPQPRPVSTAPAGEVAVSVVGMTVQEAYDTITAAGLVARTVEIDGDPQIVTKDYRTDRVNVTVSQGVVTGAVVG